MPAVEVDDIAKRYGAQCVLARLSFTIEKGEGLCLFGPSGCGKTTTLRIIAGLEAPDSGVVRLYGKEVSGPRIIIIIPPEERGVGMVFQDFALWPHMRAARHLDFVLRSRRLSRRARLERTELLLELCGLTDHRTAYPSQLSGGEQQRLCIARALAAHGGVLLLDEPFANLDAESRRRIIDEIMRRKRDEGLTIVLATHNLEDAAHLTDRTLRMKAECSNG